MRKEFYSQDNIKGIFHIEYERDGVKFAEEDYNMIVDTSSRVLAELLGGSGTFADKAVTVIKFSDGNLAVGVTKTDLDGTNKYSKAIDLSTYDAGSPYDIRFDFSLGAAEFNGYDIWQFGLFSGDGVMFSMLSRNPDKAYPIAKDASVTVTGYWKIQFRNSA